MNNIILIGLMGSGKTTVGRILGKKLGREFVDTDRVIEEKLGKSITEIFNTQGEEFFREFEKLTIAEAAKHSDTVIATGGGAVMNEENMLALKSGGKVFFLAACPWTLANRLKGDKKRPLLEGAQTVDEATDKLRGCLGSRQPLYEKYADRVVETKNKTPEQVAEEIISNL